MTTNIEPRDTDSAGGLAEVREMLRRRRFADAGKRLRSLAARFPKDAEVIGLQGAVAAEQGEIKPAMELLAKSLSLQGSPAVLRKNLHDLVSIALAHGQLSLAGKALSRPVPDADAAAALPQSDLAIVMSLANQLGIVGRYQSAGDLLTKFWEQIRNDPRALELLGALKLAGGQPREALDVLKRARSITAAPKPGLLIALGVAASAAEDTETATLATNELVRAFPTYLADRSPGQVMTIGVANWQRRPTKRFASLPEFHFRGNFIGQLADKHVETYRILSVLLNSENAIKAITESPAPDIVYNAVVNPEEILRNGIIERLATLIGVWDRPVINHPADVLKTTRQASVDLYANIESLIIPKIGEFAGGADAGALVERVEAEFDYPVIARGMTEQEGRNAFLAHDRSELETAVNELKSASRFYVIAFHESRHDGGFYRKIRAAIAGDAIHILRVDYDRTWNVHGRKSDAKIDFYKERPHLLEEEAAICADPDVHLGPQVMPALRAMRARNPLDVFGIDFDVMPDGGLLFFEANAAMNLLSTANPRIDYPKEPEARFMESFRDFARRLTETPRNAARP
jgi:Flp pilus assembly protein TadD